MALLNNKIIKSSYEQLDIFISNNIKNLSKNQRVELGKILPQLSSEINKLSRLKEKDDIKDILISILSRVLQNKEEFLSTLSFNLQELFDLSSIAILNRTGEILSLISYDEDSDNRIQLRIKNNLKNAEQFTQYNTKEDSLNIYYISIYSQS